MAIGEHASGKMRLETVIDFGSEDFKKALKTSKNELLSLSGDFADAEDIILDIVLRCEIERTA